MWKWLAEDAPRPIDLEMRDMISRFGAGAVLGQPAPVRFLRGVAIADNLEEAFTARDRSENWAQWAAEHKDQNRLLLWAMRLANG